MNSKTELIVWWFRVLILATTLVSTCASVNNLKSKEIERVETDNLIFCFPHGYESKPLDNLEKEVIYFYAKGGNSINLSRFDYLAGKELNQQLCNRLTQLFNQSEMRTLANASEAKGIKFSSNDGMKSCYYYYEFPRGEGKSRVEYKVYQMVGFQAYAITAVYTKSSPEQASLQKALHSFTIKKGIALTSAPSVPNLVIVDQTDNAYTVYTAIPADVLEEKLEEIKAQITQKEGVDIVSWQELQKSTDNYIKKRILKDEYPDSQVTEGIIELIKRFPGSPIGLTWNGGVAITYKDYQHAKETYTLLGQN
jgi:hypothetical protein